MRIISRGLCMRREEMYCDNHYSHSHGFILFIVLLFLFVITLLVVSGSQNIILDNKMQNSMQNHVAVFERAAFGMSQAVHAIEGDPITIPDSPISMHTDEKTIKTDRCGNQTIDIRSIAKNAFSTVVLNSRDIFARVHKEKNCKKTPAHRVVWWREN